MTWGQRLLHAFLPKSVLGEHKGDSKWWYSWVPVVAPIAAAIAAVAIFKIPFTYKKFETGAILGFLDEIFTKNR